MLPPGPTWIGLPEGATAPDREAPAKAAVSRTAEAPVPKPRGDIPGIPYYTRAELEEMLALIQKLDPPGIGARELQECLMLQLREAGETESLAYRLVSEASTT